MRRHPLRSWRALGALALGIAAFGVQAGPLTASSSSVLLGPADTPGAVGDFQNDNTAANVNNNNDFTAVNYTNTAMQSGGKYQSTNGAANVSPVPVRVPGGSSPIAVRITLQNGEATADTFSLSQLWNTVQLPAGWTIAFYASASPSPAPTGSPVTVTAPIPANSTADYWVKFTPPATDTTPYPITQYDYSITAKSATNPSLSNKTHVSIYFNGFVQLQKYYAVSTSGCPPNLSYSLGTGSGVICNGATIAYSIAYKNISPDPGASPGSTGNVGLSAKGVQISEDGTQPSGWASTTLGLGGTPADSASLASFTCSGSPVPGACQNATAFTATIGALDGGHGGTISYTIALPTPVPSP